MNKPKRGGNKKGKGNQLIKHTIAASPPPPVQYKCNRCLLVKIMTKEEEDVHRDDCEKKKVIFIKISISCVKFIIIYMLTHQITCFLF